MDFFSRVHDTKFLTVNTISDFDVGRALPNRGGLMQQPC